jgi:hypothetical protein
MRRGQVWPSEKKAGDEVEEASVSLPETSAPVSDTLFAGLPGILRSPGGLPADSPTPPRPAPEVAQATGPSAKEGERNEDVLDRWVADTLFMEMARRQGAPQASGSVATAGALPQGTLTPLEGVLDTAQDEGEDGQLEPHPLGTLAWRSSAVIALLLAGPLAVGRSRRGTPRARPAAKAGPVAPR